MENNSLLIYSNLEDESLASIQTGINLAEKMNLSVVVFYIHKMQDLDDMSSINPNFDSRKMEYQKLLNEKFKSKLNQQFNQIDTRNVKLSSKIYFAEDIDVINEIITKNNALMLVVPTVESEFDSFIGGNLSEKLIRLTTIPVLVSRNKIIEHINSIHFPFDFKTESFQALLSTEEITSPFRAKINPIHIVHIQLPANVSIENLDLSEEEIIVKKKLFEKFDQLESQNFIDQINLINSDHSTKETLLNYINTNNADLIIMGSSGKSAMERFYLGSYCEYILEKSETPLLIVKRF